MINKPTVIYFDCSSTIYTGLNTGIQRVVRNIIKRMDVLSKICEAPCVPVVVSSGRFCYLSTNGDSKELVEVSKKGIVEESIRNFYLKSKTSPLYRIFKNNRILSVTLLKPVGFLISNIKRLVQKILYGRRMRPISDKLKPVIFENSSILVLSDAWWVEDVAEVARKEKQKVGFHIMTLFYDLIPVTHSQYMAETNTKAFVNKLKIIKEISDSYLGISQFVMHEIQKHVSATKPADYFYLGSDFSNFAHPSVKTTVREWPLELFKESFFLVVGTLEPRKGHEYILDVFESIWDQGGSQKLCIVGRIGWEVQDLLYRLNYNKYLNKNLFVFNDINDTELYFLYQKAKALIFGSYVEGFGLPLVEAMENSLQLIASDIPVFREICQDYAQYFSHQDKVTLVNIIKNFETTDFKNYKPWLNWDQSIEMLGQRILHLQARGALL